MKIKPRTGGEGILIFTKIPCVVSYGIGHQEFDKQARVALLEFPKIFILISYNPQGGFEEKSLAFRTEWEKNFKKFLGGLKERAGKVKKGVVWAGDFNVCPSSEDWTQRAFDHIRKKVPLGTDPTGCRKIDQDSYRDMLSAIDGYDIAEIFSKGPKKRTCFPNEISLKQNRGQRLDHVVAQGCFISSDPGPKILDFDVVQEFGGGGEKILFRPLPPLDKFWGVGKREREQR